MSGHMGTPRGFARSTASGLILPEAHARERQVWTKDEAKLLERATRLIESRGIEFFLRCRHSECHNEPMTRVLAPDGGLILRCAHMDRILSRTI